MLIGIGSGIRVNVVCVVSVRQAEASCTLSVWCSCGLSVLSFLFLVVRILFKSSDMCCCFRQ